MTVAAPHAEGSSTGWVGELLAAAVARVPGGVSNAVRVVVVRGDALSRLVAGVRESLVEFERDVALTPASAEAEHAPPFATGDAALLVWGLRGDALGRRGEIEAAGLAAAFAGVAWDRGASVTAWAEVALVSGALRDRLVPTIGEWFADAVPIAWLSVERGAVGPAAFQPVVSGLRRSVAAVPADLLTVCERLVVPVRHVTDDVEQARVLLCDLGIRTAAVRAALHARGIVVAAVESWATVMTGACEMVVANVDRRAVREAWARASGIERAPLLLATSRHAHPDARCVADAIGACAFVGADASGAELADAAARALDDARRVAKECESERRVADEMRRAAECEKMATLGWLAAGIGHDLRAPLGAIRSNTELALRALDRARGEAADGPANARLAVLAELLDANLHAVSRAAEILTAVKMFVQPSGERPRGAIGVAVNHVLKLCATELHRASVVTEIDDELPDVPLFPAELLQLIANLTLNAVRAFERTGTITLRARAVTGGAVRFDVIDDGPGLPSEVRARLFSPGVTTRAESGGTGLGLSIVRRLVENAGGTVEVRTADGQGTAFHIVLPALDATD